MARGDFHRRSQGIADVTMVVLRFSCLIVGASLERAIGQRIASQLGIAAKESRVKVGVSREIIVASASGKRRKETRSGRTQGERQEERERERDSFSVFLRSPFHPSKVPLARYLDTVPVSARPNGCLLGASPHRRNFNVRLIA